MDKISAVFFDIDGTVFDGKTNQIPKSAQLGLKMLQDRGNKIFLATGRSLPALKISGLDRDIHWDGYVCSNGACLHDHAGQILWSSFFQNEQLQALFALASRYSIDLALQSDTEVFSPKPITATMQLAYRFFHSPVPAYQPYAGQKIAMALAFQQPGFDYRIIDQTIKGLKAVEGKANYADVTQDGITKATGIRRMTALLNIADCPVMAFGDADNDLEMIADADVGIAMGNATERLKEKADYITTAIEADGIYNALKHYKLI